MKVRFTTLVDADIINCYLYCFQNFGSEPADQQRVEPVVTRP